MQRLQDGLRGQDVPDYFRLDLGLTWHVRENMSLSVGAQNILQGRHKEMGSLGANAVPSEVPRSAYVQLQMEF